MNDEERKARFAAAAVTVDFVVKTAAEPVVSSRTRVAGDFHDHATRRLHTLLDSTLDIRDGVWAQATESDAAQGESDDWRLLTGMAPLDQLEQRRAAATPANPRHTPPVRVPDDEQRARLQAAAVSAGFVHSQRDAFVALDCARARKPIVAEAGNSTATIRTPLKATSLE